MQRISVNLIHLMHIQKNIRHSKLRADFILILHKRFQLVSRVKKSEDNTVVSAVPTR